MTGSLPLPADPPIAQNRRLPNWKWLLLAAATLGAIAYGIEFSRINAAVRELRSDAVSIGWDSRHGPNWIGGGQFVENESYIPGLDFNGLYGLHGPWATDDTLRALADRLPRPAFLFLENTRITDGGLSAISRWNGIVYLDIESESLSDASFETIGGLSSLVHLSLKGIDVGDKALFQLARVTSLETLTLSSTSRVRDFSPLASLPRLTILWLDPNQVNSESLATLARLPRLRTIIFRNRLPPDETLDAFRTARPDVLVRASDSWN